MSKKSFYFLLAAALAAAFDAQIILEHRPVVFGIAATVSTVIFFGLFIVCLVQKK